MKKLAMKPSGLDNFITILSNSLLVGTCLRAFGDLGQRRSLTRAMETSGDLRFLDAGGTVLNHSSPLIGADPVARECVEDLFGVASEAREYKNLLHPECG